MLALGGWPSLKGAWTGSHDPFENFYTPLIFSGMAEDKIVKFCTRVDPSSISLVIKNCNPSGRGQGHVTSNFLAK